MPIFTPLCGSTTVKYLKEISAYHFGRRVSSEVFPHFSIISLIFSLSTQDFIHTYLKQLISHVKIQRGLWGDTGRAQARKVPTVDRFRSKYGRKSKLVLGRGIM